MNLNKLFPSLLCRDCFGKVVAEVRRKGAVDVKQTVKRLENVICDDCKRRLSLEVKSLKDKGVIE